VCVFKGERYEAAKRWFWSKDFNQDTIESNTTELKRLKSVELDFTLLQLNTPVLDIAPSPMMPLAEFRKLVKNGSVKSLKAVGFGRFSKFETSDLLAGSAKRSASFTRFSFPKYTDTIKVYPTKIVKKEPVSIAVGDSGGPYFTRYRNVNYIVATVSTITYNHQGDSSFATALSVDSVIEFFKSTVFQQFTQSIGPLGYGYVKPFERKLDLDRAKKINIDENQCIHGYCVREKPLLFAALAVVPITLYTYLGCKVFNVK
jgi:hypothetical protein